MHLYKVFFKMLRPLFLYFIYLFEYFWLLTELMKVSFKRLASKRGKRIVLIFHIDCIKLQESQSHHFHIHSSAFSFVSNAIDFFIHSLTGLFWKNWLHVAGFLQSAALYAKIPFTCLQTGLGRKRFWFLCRINSFQNQNTYLRNFNLIFNDSRWYNSKMRMCTYLDQTQTITRFFYKQHFYKQRQAKIGKNLNKC